MSQEKSNLVQYFVAGGVGGALCTLVGHPFDTCKVRLQNSSLNQPEYTGTLDCFKKIIQRESFSGLFKGMGMPLATVAALNALNFLGYGVGTKLFLSQENEGQLSIPQYFAAGCFAGATTAVLVVPVDRIKCLLQIQQSAHNRMYTGPIDVIQKLTQQYGLKSLFIGFSMTMLRDMPGFGAYFATYESVKRSFLASNNSTSDSRGDVSVLAAIVSGSCAGLAYWSVCIPADVLKTRLQSSSSPASQYPLGARSVLAEILKAEGPRGLYRGAAPVFLRAVPANGACFLGFELVMRLYRLE